MNRSCWMNWRTEMFIGQWITRKQRASFSSQKLTSGQKPSGHQISTFWLWPCTEEQKGLLCFLNSFRWRRGFLERYCSWEEDQVERQRGTERLPGPRMQLVDHTDKAKHDRELQSRCCQKNLTQSLYSSCGPNKPLLRNLPWILSDGCYVQMSRRHEVSKLKPRLGLWRYLWRISAQVVYSMKNECIVSIEARTDAETTEMDDSSEQKAAKLEVLSLIEYFQQMLIIRTNRQRWKT